MNKPINKQIQQQIFWHSNIVSWTVEKRNEHCKNINQVLLFLENFAEKAFTQTLAFHPQIVLSI